MNKTTLLHFNGQAIDKISITAEQILLVQKTWKIFRGIKPAIVGDVFYSKLFSEMPALKRLFKNPMTIQYQKLTDMISMIVGRLHQLEEVTDDIRQMAKRHVGYGVKITHYKTAGAALLWTLEQGLGNDWNEEIKEAWANCYALLSTTMIEASGY